jgi:hypothetical protein
MPGGAVRCGAADEWAWSPLTVGDVSCGPCAEEAKALMMLRMILSMGLERPLWFPL